MQQPGRRQTAVGCYGKTTGKTPATTTHQIPNTTAPWATGPRRSRRPRRQHKVSGRLESDWNQLLLLLGCKCKDHVERGKKVPHNNHVMHMISFRGQTGGEAYCDHLSDHLLVNALRDYWMNLKCLHCKSIRKSYLRTKGLCRIHDCSFMDSKCKNTFYLPC